MLRVIAAVLLAASCGDRRPAPVSTPPVAEVASPPTSGATPDASARDASADDAVAHAPPEVLPDAPPGPHAYRVRLVDPSRIAVVAQDLSCTAAQASCRADACFVVAPYVDRPPSKPGMVACERDSDCTVAHTSCCDPSNDVRAIRTDQLATVPAHVCRSGKVCGPPDPALLASFTIGCVEHRCQLLQPLPATWCEDRDIRYRVMLRDGTVVARDRLFDCHGHAPSCRVDVDCYREVEQRAPRPPASLARCKRDSDCTLAPVECCECGASEFRAVRIDALDRWRETRCAAKTACPACVTPLPSDLAPACLRGRCEVVQVQEAAACKSR